jgi:D-glycero-alpha-D-manno-heptose-7-phosphate kinase
VDQVDDLQHELAREALRFHGVREKIEVSSMADLPDGTGLGSSGAYLVGLLTALHHYRRDYVSLQALAEEACHIELEVLKKGIGKQDQYMAVYGGLTVLNIESDGTVTPRPVHLSAGSAEAFVANTHLYYTGLRRSAAEVLSDQNGALNGTAPGRETVEESLHRIKELGYRILGAIEDENFDGWGMLLHEHWCHKRRMSAKISNSGFDAIYEHARREFGVLGGKIVGAGGGGFLMLYAPREHERLEQFLLEQGMPRLHYQLEREGSRVIVNLASGPTMRRTAVAVHV